MDSQSSKSIKERLSDLKSHITNVEQLTKQFEQDGLVIPNAEKFINSCKEIKKKIDIHKEAKEADDKINHLKDHIAELEDLTAEVNKENLESKSFDDFVQSCIEFKQTLDNRKSESDKKPNESDMNVISKINAAIESSKEAKEEGLVSSSVDNFIKSCEQFKHLINDHKLPKRTSSVDAMKTLRCNINNMMDLMNKTKNKGPMKTNVDSFFKLCQSFMSKLNDKLVQAGIESDPCYCVDCKSNKEDNIFESAYRMPGGEIFIPSKKKTEETCSIAECNCMLETNSCHSLARIPEEDVCGNCKQKKGHPCQLRKPDSTTNSIPPCAVDSKAKVADCCAPVVKVAPIESFHSIRKTSGGEVFAPSKDTKKETCCVECEKKIGESKSFHSYGRVAEDAISNRSKHSNACGCVKCACQPDKPIETAKSTDTCSLLSKGEMVRKVVSGLITDSIKNIASLFTSRASEDKKMSGEVTNAPVKKEELLPEESSKKCFVLRRLQNSDTNSPSCSSVPRKGSKTVAIYNKCLALIEKQVRKIIKISRVRNPDGTIKEVKEIITIKQKKRNND